MATLTSCKPTTAATAATATTTAAAAAASSVTADEMVASGNTAAVVADADVAGAAVSMSDESEDHHQVRRSVASRFAVCRPRTMASFMASHAHYVHRQVVSFVCANRSRERLS